MEESITTTINKNINEKFKEIENKYEILQNTTEEQEKRIDYIEKHIRRKNIILYGLEEKENQYEEFEKEVLQFINDKMSVNCMPTEVDSLRRLGKKGTGTRPILLTLTTFNKKIKIMKNRKNLKGTSYYIKDDYPRKILEQRKKLNLEVEKLREQGKNAIIKYNKIVLIPGETLQGNNKRSLPESPENTDNNRKPTSSKPTIKKNKMDISNYLRQRTKHATHQLDNPSAEYNDNA